MDKELKKEDINIRIEKSVKQEFKLLCSQQDATMSEKIMELIYKELEQKNK
jgi:antitoxin component of RelBE/YafQ-DinJ toxin-antitoxin module